MMIRNLNLPTEICTNQLSSIPIDGRWRWNEQRRELIYESRNQINDKKKLNSNEILKIDLRTGLINYRKQNRPFQQLNKTKEENRITLRDVIEVSLNVMSELFYLPIEFEEYVRMPPVQEYLLCLLNYFQWFFETMNNASPKNEQHIDRSEREKNRIRISYAHLLAALGELNCKYAILLLGINLKDYHHMRNGDLFYSCTEVDRTISESFCIFSTYFIWITFYRQNFDLIRAELARLFRAGSDMELVKMPMTESLESRMTNDASYRHKLIDCNEFFSKSMAKKAAIARNSDIPSRKWSIQRSSSIIWNVKKMTDQPDMTSKQRRLRSFLARDFHQQDENDEEDRFEGRSPLYRQKQQLLVSQRQNRIRGILTKQLKSRNQSLTEERDHSLKKKNEMHTQSNKEDIEKKIQEREQIKRERLIMQKLLNPSFYKNKSLLPAAHNPLDDPSITKGKETVLPAIQYQMQENLGIIGKPYVDFDLTRLTLKPDTKDSIIIPTELLLNEL